MTGDAHDGAGGADARPAWLVLDAARSHRFTGEVVFRTQPVVRVSFDRGEIYFAERTSDPALPQRLVEAGVLTPTQVDRGSVRIGGVRHLGRLFDRVPGLDPHALLLAVDLLTEECVSWLAARQVSEVAWIPYRRHSSGVHQWRDREGRPVADLVDPMLSPLAASSTRATSIPSSFPADSLGNQTDDRGRTPVGSGSPDSFESVTADVRIEWEEPGWLDRTNPVGAAAARPAPVGRTVESVDDAASADVAASIDDWGSGVVTSPVHPEPPVRRRRPAPDPLDRFELVWPSGEIDDQLASIDDLSNVAVLGDEVPVSSDDADPVASGTSLPGGSAPEAPARPSTTIRRATTGEPTNGHDDIAESPSVDETSGDVGIDAHPATRRRMLPRRR